LVIDRAKSPRTLIRYSERGHRALLEWQVRFGPLPESEEPTPPWPGQEVRIEMGVDEPPDISVGNDRFIHLIDRSRDLVIERTMSAFKLAVYLDRADAAIADWQRSNSGGIGE
jgi:hypothetical protein